MKLTDAHGPLAEQLMQSVWKSGYVRLVKEIVHPKMTIL